MIRGKMVSLYLIVLGMLCIGAFDEGFIKKRDNNRLYSFLFFVLLLMLCFRYGQGTDYFGYKYNYVNMPSFSSIQEAQENWIHGELGWKLLCSVCNNYFNMPFELFVAIISVIEMYSLNRFINKYCTRKILALLIFYPTYYLTYYFSTLRQGLVLSIFLGFLLGYCINKNYICYYVGVLLLSFIHTASLILLILPVIHALEIKLKQSLMYVIGCFILGSIIGYTGLKVLLPYSSSDFSLVAVAERMVSYIIVIITSSHLYNTRMIDDRKNIFISITNVYMLGMMIYGIFFSSGLLSGRIIIFFKCMELAILGIAAKYVSKSYQIVYLYSILLAIVMTIKNIDSYIGQLNYVDTVTVLNYPYISIFNSEAIKKYSQDFFADYFH